MSVVYYIPTEDDDLLIATMAGRAKAKAAARNGKVSICVLDETWPFRYLQVYCDAVVERDRELVVDVMMAVGERMSGEPIGPEARPFVSEIAEREQRIVLRCRPYATFTSPPRHLNAIHQGERLTPWLSSSVPWDAPDEPPDP